MMGGPSIKHLDDVPTEEMLRWRFGDGHTASIWEKWIEMSPRYFEFTHIMLEWGDLFGRWEAGPEGCELYGFIAGEGTPFSGDPAVLQRLLDERGATSVPRPMPVDES